MKFSLLKLEWKKKARWKMCFTFDVVVHCWLTRVGKSRCDKSEATLLQQSWLRTLWLVCLQKKKHTHTLYNIYKDVGIWTCVKKQSKVKCEQKHLSSLLCSSVSIVAVFLPEQKESPLSRRVGRIWFSADADRTHGCRKKRNRTSFCVRSKIHHHHRNKTLL